MFPDFQDRPGLLFVLATFLPLASFVLIILAATARAALRRYRESAVGGNLYNLFGGDVGGRLPAYIATAAIGLACVCSVIGFVRFSNDHGHFEEAISEQRKEIKHLKEELDHKGLPRAEREDKEGALEVAQEQLEQAEARWRDNPAYKGQVTWLRLNPTRIPDPARATTLNLGFSIDSLSALMFVMVTFIATLIHVFSMGYMKEEEQPTVEDHQVHTAGGHLRRRGRFGRFFMYLSLFCFSMLNLVLADNLFQVFLSWELVGICSYLLVGFYFERQSASNAANKAFITNRVGDAGFIIGLLIVWTYLGTFNFDEMFRQVRSPLADSHGSLQMAGQFVRGNLDAETGKGGQRSLKVDPAGSNVVLFPRQETAEHHHGIGPDRDDRVDVYDAPKPTQHGTIPYWLMVAAGLGIFLGCVGKSAQFPLHVWLPDAMEGPTPVSALIHAATMVAAGVYLVGRVYPLFTPDALLVIAYTGGITLFVAATIAVVMTDIKKVLAYSTVSQLGYMMLALGVGGWVAGLFHLMTHAFFKALLFLCSGAVIYGCHHEQDMRKMGGLFSKMPVTAITMFIGFLAIAGIPLFTGWYSKDAILAQALGYSYVHREHSLLFVLPLATAGLTAFYMARMWFLTFAGEPRDAHVYEHAHEPPRLMTVPLIILAACSIFVAWGWPLWDAEASWLEHNVHHSQPTAVMADFGSVLDQENPERSEPWEVAREEFKNERMQAVRHHGMAGALALTLVGIGIVFAAAIYYWRALDPEEAREQFPRLHAFLTDKWRFDLLYSVLLVRPALVVAGWCKAFDTYVLDGFINALARGTVRAARWDGRFDNGIIDGIANLIGNFFWGIGTSLRRVQTGFLRSYVLFLALAAVGIFILLTYLVNMAAAR